MVGKNNRNVVLVMGGGKQYKCGVGGGGGKKIGMWWWWRGGETIEMQWGWWGNNKIVVVHAYVYDVISVHVFHCMLLRFYLLLQKRYNSAPYYTTDILKSN